MTFSDLKTPGIGDRMAKSSIGNQRDKRYLSGCERIADFIIMLSVE
jgi:hypothetical protein